MSYINSLLKTAIVSMKTILESTETVLIALSVTAKKFFYESKIDKNTDL